MQPNDEEEKKQNINKNTTTTHQTNCDESFETLPTTLARILTVC